MENNMYSTIAFWVSILASVATVASAIIAVVTLRAMRRQTESSYKPDLYLSCRHLKCLHVKNWLVNDREIGIENWTDKNDINKSFESHGVLFSIENIGFGVAKKIKIDFTFDFNLAIECIKSMLPEHYELKIYGGSSVFISDTNDDLNIYSFYMDLNDTSTEYDFVLPRKDEKFNMSPSISPEIITLFTLYFIFKNDLENVGGNFKIFHESFEDFPPLSLKLDYYDLGDKKFSKKFSVSLAISISNLDSTLNLTEVEQPEFNIYLNFHQN